MYVNYKLSHIFVCYPLSIIRIEAEFPVNKLFYLVLENGFILIYIINPFKIRKDYVH